MKKYVLLALLCALSACGGGGGGGGSNDGGSGSAPVAKQGTGLQINLNTAPLSFKFSEGSNPIPVVVNATGSGEINQDVYIGASVTGAGVVTPVDVAVNPQDSSARIMIRPQTGLAAGTYSGTVQVVACTTKACTQHHGGSPFNIPYKIAVMGTLKTNTGTVDLASAESGSSAAVRVPVTLPAGADGLQAGITYHSYQTGWLSAETSTDGVKLQASAASLRAGTYKASLALSANMAAGALTIPVTLTVSDGLVVPAQSTLRFDSETTAAAASQSVPVNIAPGATATRWNAVSSQPWLRLDAASGDFNTPLTWRIDASSFAQLANNASYKATVRVQADGVTERNLVVNVEKRLAQIKYTDLLALTPGVAGEVLVFGSNFDTLAKPEDRVRVNGVAPLAVTRVNAGLLRLSLPAMEAGDHVVSVGNAAGLPSPTGTVTSLAPRSYGYQSVAAAGRKRQLVWDAVGQNAYVVNMDLKSVMRYSLSSGVLALAASRSFTAIDSIGLTPDRSALLLKEGTSRLHHLALSDLATLKTIDLSANGSCCTGSNKGQNLPVMGDGSVFMRDHGWVDPESGAVRALNINTYNVGSLADWAAVSGNGLRMLWPDSGLYSPHSPIYRYELTDSVFQAITPGNDGTYFYRYAVNRDGSRWLFNDRVYGFDLTVKGNVRVPDGWYGNWVVMSRSGARSYYYAQSASSTDKARIYVFDTGATLTSTLDFPVIGYIEVDDRPNCSQIMNSDSHQNCFPFETGATLTDDGQTLILAGDRSMVVLPIPAEFRAPPPGAATPAPVLMMQKSR
ncbi:BACON domain-containing protein [Noviherbaspirillum aerium]|uniref:BACON domain-containing protein n=1 Tax=Noviherbaspirillum aerium TaxID=2588497 RepID=UPI00124F6713|nr:BACON domain-containing protein [Noviherbaspirillum aerium]